MNRQIRYFAGLLILIWCSTSMIHCKKAPPPAPFLTYAEQTILFSAVTGFPKTLSIAKILAGVQGSGKEGYTIKSISLVSSSTTASAKVSGTLLTFTKPGHIVFHLVLKHDSWGDVTIKNCKIIISKDAAADLRWRKQSKAYRYGGEITNAELLGGVRGSKLGYRIKTVQITSDSSSSGARVSGSGTAAKIVGYGKTTILTLTLVLQHATKAEKTITGAEFEITKMMGPTNLTWVKQLKRYRSGEEISNSELLAGLEGSKVGYRVKTVEITTDSGGSGATVSGSGTAAKIINYSKPTILTLTLVFEHATKAEKTITGAQFELTSGAVSVPLSWSRQSKVYSAAGEISNAELLGGVRGTKTGYRIKSVQITSDSSSSGARVSGSGTATKIVGYGKPTILTLTLVFEHATKAEKTITGAQFELTSGAVSVPLSWSRQSKVYGSPAEISNAELLGGVRGTKDGYRIKSVQITSDSSSSGARVSGSGTAAKIIGYGKATILTLTLVLERPYKLDVTISNAQFAITKTSAESLSWTKQTKPFSWWGEITNTHLLAGVTGSGKTGYTIKTVIITNKNGTSARVSGSGGAAKITSYNKVGTLTLTLILEHDTKKDVTIANAQFHIYSDIFTISGGVVTLKTSVSRSSLITVTIPYMISGTTVTSIENYAFYNCSNLTSITIPNSVTSIGEGAFSRCSSLTSITMGNSITSIGKEAFYSCVKLTRMTIPNSVTSIGYRAFYECIKLTSITMGNSVTSIGNQAFTNCKSLTSITIPNSVTSIGNFVFYGCSSLTRITMGNSVTSIGYKAFYSCVKLASITIPNSVTSIGNEAFYGCSSLTNITMGNSLTSIGNEAFSSCIKLASITIPNSVTSIGNEAFYGCSLLNRITMGNSVTSIGSNAFYGCTSLNRITIPNSVISIGSNPFAGCSKLTTIWVPKAKVLAWSAKLKAFNAAKVEGY